MLHLVKTKVKGGYLSFSGSSISLRYFWLRLVGF